MFKILKNTDEPLLVEICVPDFENYGPDFGDLLRKSHELEYGEDFDYEDCDDYEYESEKLEVWLPEENSWSDAFSAQVEEFLNYWKRVKSEVSRALLKDYNYLYPYRVEGRIEHYEKEFNEFTLPKSPSVSDLEKFCQVRAICIHSDGESIGIFGDCLWELEHGFGVVIKNGTVIEIGYGDSAFELNS